MANNACNQKCVESVEHRSESSTGETGAAVLDILWLQGIDVQLRNQEIDGRAAISRDQAALVDNADKPAVWLLSLLLPLCCEDLPDARVPTIARALV